MSLIKDQEYQMYIQKCIQWIEENLDCEVYLLSRVGEPNGFAEYRNGGHVIYILGNQEQMELTTFLDILAHEAGHVIYNKRRMQQGIKYDEIVERTKAKLNCFDQLLKQNLINDDEFDRLYAAIEEEWESNKEKEKILAEFEKLFE